MTATKKKPHPKRQEMDLIQLFDLYGSEDKARACLEHLRWPDGVHCLRCGMDRISRISSPTYHRTGPKKGQVRGTREQFDCVSCGYQFSVTAGTVLHDTHLPLWKWFLATYLMCESRKGMSANQLKRTLRVSYETAWYLCHRIRWAMTEAYPEPLSGIVEADETFVGGRLRKGKYKTKKEAALHRMDNKTIVVGAIERGGRLRVRTAEDTTADTIEGFIEDAVSDDATAIYSDSNPSYRQTGTRTRTHAYVDHTAEEWVRGDVHTNTIESAWSLFDRAVIGSYHKLSRKHMDAYLAEFEFRFNNRANPFLFRDTLLKLLSADPKPFAELVAGKRA